MVVENEWVGVQSPGTIEAIDVYRWPETVRKGLSVETIRSLSVCRVSVWEEVQAIRNHWEMVTTLLNIERLFLLFSQHHRIHTKAIMVLEVASLTENIGYSQRLRGNKTIGIEVIESVVEVIVKAAAEKAGLAVEREHAGSLRLIC